MTECTQLEQARTSQLASGETEVGAGILQNSRSLASSFLSCATTEITTSELEK